MGEGKPSPIFFMDLSTFKYLLHKLNPRIYVDDKHRVVELNPMGTSGIYLRGERYEYTDSSVLSGESKRLLDAYNSSPDIYIGWTTHGSVPEGDIFDDKGRIIARGWRTTLKSLWQKGYINKNKAQKIFGWNPSDYDYMTYEQKIEFERKYATSTDSRIYS